MLITLTFFWHPHEGFECVNTATSTFHKNVLGLDHVRIEPKMDAVLAV